MIKLRDILFNTNANQQIMVRLRLADHELDGIRIGSTKTYEGTVNDVCNLLRPRAGLSEDGNYFEYNACIAEVSENRIVIDCSRDDSCYKKSNFWRGV